ncbi:MAG TPA: GntR family transcriptional regulator [Phycisphaerae bacterium]|nr:GntR family transcriptional regulator [Phycisphaerae bacterium]
MSVVKEDKTNLSSRVYSYLRERLINHELVPGDMLVRRDVAAKLGVSVAPVLEAFVQLESEGYIESIPRVGTRVRSVRMEDVRGQLLVREALECQAARLYCGKTVAQHESALYRLAEDIQRTTHTPRGNWRAEVRFHHELVSLAQVPFLTKEFDRITKLGLFMQVSMIVADDPEIESSNHVQLITDLQTTNPDEAERLIRSHIRMGKADLL